MHNLQRHRPENHDMTEQTKLEGYDMWIARIQKEARDHQMSEDDAKVIEQKIRELASREQEGTKP